MKPALVTKGKIRQIWPSREAMPPFSPKFMMQVVDVPDDAEIGFKLKDGVWRAPQPRPRPTLADRVEHKLRHDPMWNVLARVLANGSRKNLDEIVQMFREECR